MDRVLIAGCGYVGSRLAELLVEDGVAVWGLKRDPDGLPAGVRPVAADVTDPASLADIPDDLGAVVYAVSPAGRTEAAYRAAYVDGLGNVLDALDGDARVLLVSSTGVYGQTDGRWVDEETAEEPADETAAAILEGEAMARERGAPGAVLRLGGIYGPGRTWTVRRVISGDAPCPGPEVYGNRIHRDDAAGALRHLLTLPDPAPVYLGVDREPAPLREVYAWIARRAGVPGPCEGVDPGDGRNEGRRGTNKRCSSRRLVESGYVFRYPTYREGYAPLVDVAAG
ncbi:MAG: SDR family oxidoreductase [Gemmatimonadota bacterium]